MTRTNPYCDALGIAVARLETTARFERAGIAPAGAALASLKRCKPGRAPIYRDGDLYALDPHDAETELWAFRLGLRPRDARLLPVVARDPGPLPSIDEPLTPEALDEAWREDIPNTWSSQRIAVCVLDAHDTPMRLGDLRSFVEARAPHASLPRDDTRYRRRGAPIRERGDGRWELDRQHPAVRSARRAVRDRIETRRRWADLIVLGGRRRDDRARRRSAGARCEPGRFEARGLHGPTGRAQQRFLRDTGRHGYGVGEASGEQRPLRRSGPDVWRASPDRNLG